LVQVAAYREMDRAMDAALDAEREVPGSRGVLEVEGEYIRVALEGWDTAADAEAVRSRLAGTFPQSWVRRRLEEP
jgi:hypothetical protein